MTSTRMSAGNGFSRAEVHQLVEQGKRNGVYDLDFDTAEAILADHEGDRRKASDHVYAMGKARKIAEMTERFTGLKSFVTLSPHVGEGDPAHHEVVACTMEAKTLEFAVTQAEAEGKFVTFYQWNEDGENIEHRVRPSAVWKIVAFDVEAHGPQIA